MTPKLQRNRRSWNWREERGRVTKCRQLDCHESRCRNWTSSACQPTRWTRDNQTITQSLIRYLLVQQTNASITFWNTSPDVVFGDSGEIPGGATWRQTKRKQWRFFALYYGFGEIPAEYPDKMLSIDFPLMALDIYRSPAMITSWKTDRRSVKS